VAASLRARDLLGQYRGRALYHQIDVMIARYVPGLAESVASTFALADASKLGSLFDEVGFDTVRHAFVLPSFDAYYGPFERGGCSTGQALVEEIRRAVREEARRDLRDTGGPVKPEAEYRNCQRPTLKEREHRLPRPGERLVPARLPARSYQEGGERPPNEINRIKAIISGNRILAFLSTREVLCSAALSRQTR